MPWSTSDRKSTLPEGWDKLRLEILKRDGRRCRHIRYDTGRPCGARATDVDHIDRLGSQTSPENLVSLCGHHHSVKSSSEGGSAASAKRAAAKKAAAGRHPGYRE